MLPIKTPFVVGVYVGVMTVIAIIIIIHYSRLSASPITEGSQIWSCKLAILCRHV